MKIDHSKENRPNYYKMVTRKSKAGVVYTNLIKADKSRELLNNKLLKG